ncbi:hypothetical protein AB0F91_39730 [Amycolatopsis sp. NPDC023774]|uniref:AbiTii domain-containing protein n=1 Tax=Amycolatopsis sp. NPDC023774 TaxID=3155015 RepID=UPI0033EC8EFD
MLDDIISSATSGDASVAALLRSVQVLATRTGARELASWIARERDGYGENDPLPAYRGPRPAHVLAQFTGPFSSGVTDFPIPRAAFPEEFQPLFEIRLLEPIASMEDSLLQLGAKDGAMMWSTDAVMRANRLIQSGDLHLLDGYGLVKARQVIPRGLVVGAVEAVRNRVLGLALELEQVLPDLDDIPTHDLPAQRETVSAVYNVVVHQGGQAIVGNSEVLQVSAEVTPGDITSLRRYLDGVRGLTDEQRRELISAAQEIESDAPAKKAGKTQAVMKKVGEIVGKGVEQAVTIAVKAGMEHWLGPGAS